MTTRTARTKVKKLFPRARVKRGTRVAFSSPDTHFGRQKVSIEPYYIVFNGLKTGDILSIGLKTLHDAWCGALLAAEERISNFVMEKLES